MFSVTEGKMKIEKKEQNKKKHFISGKEKLREREKQFTNLTLCVSKR